MITADPELLVDENSPIKRGCAFDLINMRLNLGVWEMFSRTKFRNRINLGDRLGFYVAGSKKKAGEIIAVATVAGEAMERDILPIHSEYNLDSPHRIFSLDSIIYLKHSPNLRNLFFTLQMSKGVSHNKWGASLMGGAKQISDTDWKTLGLP